MKNEIPERESCANDSMIIESVTQWMDATVESIPDQLENGAPSGNPDLADVVECLGLLESVWPSRVLPNEPHEIGPFQLERRLGVGGMGEVWLAEQLQPIRRKLAIKLIRPEYSSPQAMARFASERSLLALMTHPHIAQVIDAGTASDGRLYLAMEYVDGTPLTQYCDEHRLTIEQRVRLVITICEAIQHAHQKGVIHRDLKPSNVLITEIECRPVPKVIDFGLAKLVIDENNELTIDSPTDANLTVCGQILGTIQYMSPEQASHRQPEVDSRTDVYSLGVMLFELLTGSTPIRETPKSHAALMMTAAELQDSTVIAPSSRLEKTGERDQVLERRRADWPKFRRQLRTDLDWIVARATAPDPAARYASAEGLAADLRRFLEDEPVVARPLTRRYRFGKFARRNRFALVAAGMFAAAVIAGLTGTIVGLSKAVYSQRQANARLVTSQQSNRILAGILEGLDLDRNTPPDIPLRQTLADGLIAATGDIDFFGGEDPTEAAEVQLKLGRALNSLGFPDQAMPMCTAAHRILLESTGWENELTREAIRELARCHRKAGELEQARDLLDTLVEWCRAELGPSDLETLAGEDQLGRVLLDDSRYQEAVMLLTTVVERRIALAGRDDHDTSQSVLSLATGLVGMWDHMRAIPLLEDSLRYSQKYLPEGHPQTIRTLNNLSWALCRADQRARGLSLAEEAWSLARQYFGTDHRLTRESESFVGLSAFAVGDTDRALKRLESALGGLEISSGRQHPITIDARNVLAKIHVSAGDLRSALRLIDESRSDCLSRLAPDHPLVIRSTLLMADTLLEAGDSERARELLLEYNRSDSLVGKTAFQKDWRLGRTWMDENEFGPAIECFQSAMNELTELPGYPQFEATLITADLARSLAGNGRFEEAIQRLQKRLEFLETGTDGQGKEALILKAQLGIVLAQSGQRKEGIKKMQSVMQSRVRLKNISYLADELRTAWMQEGKVEEVGQSLLEEQRFCHRLPAGSVQRALQLQSQGAAAMKFENWPIAADSLSEAESILANVRKNSWDHLLIRLQLATASIGVSADGDGEIPSDSSIKSELHDAWNGLLQELPVSLPVERRVLTDNVRILEQLLRKKGQLEAANLWRTRSEIPVKKTNDLDASSIR